MLGRRLSETGRQRDRVLARLSVLHDNSTAQPSLFAGDIRQSDSAQLHDHSTGTAGPATRHCGCQGEAGARREEERVDH